MKKEKDICLNFEQIGATYIEYAKIRKQIEDLKYDRNVERKECLWTIDETYLTCYDMAKEDHEIELCKNCDHSWNQHIEIQRLGAIAGGLKNKLNWLMKNE